ncbi:MFS transporter [Nocardia sp. CDC153]|uniref:MFS transporter n=1 Tax=Nocardia sp. CDC153 TaxID=3112167 RepID=UPI002DBC4D2A|nr:MFS transporter [Nocardia sp. CDC153]MEC3953938.1 MFS transporter [Nocardia sp. CDC153]
MGESVANPPVGTDPTAVGNRAGRAGTGGILTAMCTCLVLVVASVSAINLAMPDLAVDLSASTTSLTWIADAYTVALAAFVLPIGALGDRFGRRDVLIGGTAVFAIGSAAAAFADSTHTLIAWRVVMGVGAAMIMPGTLSTITAVFPAERRDRGVAIWSGFAAAGAILGMLAAGLLLEVWSWRSIFVASAVVAVIGGLLALLLVPNTRDEEGHPLDHLGAYTSAVAIGALVYGIIEGSDAGWTSHRVMGSFAVSVAALALYAALGFRNKHALLDPRLFGIPGFRAGAATVLVQFLAVFGFFFVGLQYLQLILGYSALKSAVALVPIALVVMPVSVLTPRLIDRAGIKAVMSVGLLLLGGGIYALSFLHVDSGYVPFLGGLVLAGLGVGMTSAVGTSVIVGSLRAEQQGVASAMNDATREVGSAIGIALMGSVFSSHYKSSLPSLDQLPPAAAHAVESSAAAGLQAASLLGPKGEPLTAAVRSAFIDGLSASLVVVAIIVGVAALGALLDAPRTQAPPR